MTHNPKYCEACNNTGFCQSCEGCGCMECNYTGLCRHCQDVSYAEADPQAKQTTTIITQPTQNCRGG